VILHDLGPPIDRLDIKLNYLCMLNSSLFEKLIVDIVYTQGDIDTVQ